MIILIRFVKLNVLKRGLISDRHKLSQNTNIYLILYDRFTLKNKQQKSY